MSKKKKRYNKKLRDISDFKVETKINASEIPVVKKTLITRKSLAFALKVFTAAFTLGMVLFLISIPFTKWQNDKKVLGTVSGVPYKAEKPSLPEPPEVTAKSAIVVSTKKNKPFVQKNIDLKLPPASTTKILTSLLAIKEFRLDEVVEVPELCTKLEGSKMGLLPQEKINVESLLYGTLVVSAGDAACTLSETKLSEGAFISKMNTLAQALNLKNTTLTNAIGFDFDETSHVSTARDLYLMTREAMKNGEFRKIVGTKEISLYSADGKTPHYVRSTNQLLFEIPGSIGVKTGTTPRAKEVLVYDYSYQDDEIIIVVMGSDDRFGDARKLLNYTLENYNKL